MSNVIAKVLESISSISGGTSSTFCAFLIWDEPECPDELL